MASLIETGSFLDSDKSVEPSTKRSRKSISKNPKYINRIDGKGCYLRFSMSFATIETASSFIGSLYEDKLIDDHYCHLYNRNKTTQGLPDAGNKCVLHCVLHVVSRDYDFQFWRKRLPKAHFKISLYPDDTYKTVINKEVIQTGQVLPNANMAMPINMGQCQFSNQVQPMNNQMWVQ